LRGVRVCEARGEWCAIVRQEILVLVGGGRGGMVAEWRGALTEVGAGFRMVFNVGGTRASYADDYAAQLGIRLTATGMFAARRVFGWADFVLWGRRNTKTQRHEGPRRRFKISDLRFQRTADGADRSL
jgi:hypothetical protein